MLNAEIISYYIEGLTPFCVLDDRSGRFKQRLPRLVARIGGVELVAGLGGDDFGQIGAIHFANASCPGNEHVGVQLGGGDCAAHYAAVAQVANKCAGVDFGEDWNCVALHIFVGDLFGAPVGTDGGEFANDQALNEGTRGLVVRAIGAVVADLWVGEDDDLASVGGIGGNFLITGERGVKNDFTLAFAQVSMAVAAEDAPVFERENGLHCLSEEWIQSILAGLWGLIWSGFPRISAGGDAGATKGATEICAVA